MQITKASDVLIGKTFNNLTVVTINEDRTNKKRKYFDCVCKCGNKTIVRSDQIRNGHTKSCGCLKAEHMRGVSNSNVIKLVGEKFGRLTVVAESTRRANGDNGNYFWECECICGNKTTVRSSYLRNGQVLSCGCYHKDLVNGASNPNFNPILTTEHRRRTRNQLYGSSQSTFRNRVLKRDNFSCQLCSETDGLVAHHLDSYDKHIDVRFDMKNGVTLCSECHLSFHKKHGFGNNTNNQYKEFEEGYKV